MIFLTNLVGPLTAASCALQEAHWQASAQQTVPRASESAVKTKVWTAVSVFVPVAIVKKQPKPDVSLRVLLETRSILEQTSASRYRFLFRLFDRDTVDENSLNPTAFLCDTEHWTFDAGVESSVE